MRPRGRIASRVAACGDAACRAYRSTGRGRRVVGIVLAWAAVCFAAAAASAQPGELVLTPLEPARLAARAATPADASTDPAGASRGAANASSARGAASPAPVAADTPALPPRRPGQLPHSRVAFGTRDIAAAWLARPTARYPHGVLGDELEAAQLVVERRDGAVFNLELPPTRVFEDLEPRLFDLDGDGRDEIILVESDRRLGASVAVYGIDAGGLRRRAASAFIGRPNRWLNPLGAGDFDGDGRPDIAVVETPHIGGILRLFHYAEPTLRPFAEYLGVSTHRLGNIDLAMGRVVSRYPRDRLLLPDQAHRRMRLLEWTAGGIVEVAGADLPARLDSALMPVGSNRWQLRLADGRRFELRAR